MSERETNPKDALASTKARIGLVPVAMNYYAAMQLCNGGHKYGPWNFRACGVRASVYYEGVKRHLDDWYDGNERDEEGIPNMAGLCANVAILADAVAHGYLVDDRPPSVNLRRLIQNVEHEVKAAAERHKDRPKARAYTIEDPVFVPPVVEASVFTDTFDGTSTGLGDAWASYSSLSYPGPDLQVGAGEPPVTPEEDEAWRERTSRYPAEMTDAAERGEGDGWIAWNGGECPVAASDWVELCFRTGAEVVSCPGLPTLFNWRHDGGPEDIVAYKVVTPKLEQKDEGWIEWKGGKCPVNGYTFIEVQRRSGRTETDLAMNLRWTHVLRDAEHDIVAYRVAERRLAEGA